MKLFSNQTLMFSLLLLSGVGYIASCTHENGAVPEPIATGPVVTHGTDILLPGAMAQGNANEWKFDKVHSSTLWTTSYAGASGLLTGRFNQFGVHEVTTAEMLNYTLATQPVKDDSWAFYENEPAKSFFRGYVQINQSNTGEPGRDAGCNVAAMGTTAIVAGTQNLTVGNLAQIKTTEIKFDDASNDYIVKFDLTWQGKLTAPITKSIVGRLKYIKKGLAGTTTTTPYGVFGLQLSFQFNCRDFGIVSTSIADKIDIQCNINFNNK